MSHCATGNTTCLQVSIDAWNNSEYHEHHSNVGLAQNYHCLISKYFRPVVLNRRPLGPIRPPGRLFVVPKLLFLHHVFWLGQHMYTGTCLCANNTQTGGSLTAASAIFNFHFCFWSSSYSDMLPVVGAGKCCVPSSLLKEKWTVKIGNLKKNGLTNLHSFALQPAEDPCV